MVSSYLVHVRIPPDIIQDKPTLGTHSLYLVDKYADWLDDKDPGPPSMLLKLKPYCYPTADGIHPA